MLGSGQYYKAQEITSKVKISNEAVQRYFEQEGYGRERLLNAIKVGSRAAIDTVLQELRAGRSFAEVAQARSLDERSAERGWRVGLYRSGPARVASHPTSDFQEPASKSAIRASTRRLCLAHSAL